MTLASRLHGTHQHAPHGHGPAHGDGHGHGSGNAETEGITLEHGQRYETFTNVFFLGRRGALFDRLARLSGARPGDRVLDVGCGTGYLTRRLARIVLSEGPERARGAEGAPPGGPIPRGSVTGLDASAGMLAQAERLSPPSAAYVVGAAEELEFEEGSFDVVTSTLMLHHLPRELRDRALSEMHRVLRPGGRLLIGEFRPPRSRLGRHLVGALTDPAMLEDQGETLPARIREAGFEGLATGELRPWIAYFQAVRH